MQATASGKGQPEEDIGIFSFPIVAGGKGKATDTLGGVNGFLVTKTAPKEAVDFLSFFSQEKYAKEAAEKGAYIPAQEGSDAWVKDPLVKQVAAELAATTYIRTSSIRIWGLRSAGSSTTSPSQWQLGGRRQKPQPQPSRTPGTSNNLRMVKDRVALASTPAREQVACLPEAAFANAPAVYVENRRRMSMNGWATLLVFLPPALLLFTIFVALRWSRRAGTACSTGTVSAVLKGSSGRLTLLVPAIRPSPGR